MRKALYALIMVILAGAAPYAVAVPLGFDNARHLLARTGFAATPADIDTYSRLTREQAVDRLLAQTTQPRGTPPPAWVN